MGLAAFNRLRRERQAAEEKAKQAEPQKEQAAPQKGAKPGPKKGPATTKKSEG